jgi:GNAT superfamily N-acetyltransferase
LDIRSVTVADIPAIASLLGELGYPSTADDVSRRFETLANHKESIALVAADSNGPIGIAHVHLLPVLHSSDGFAQLVLIVVAERARRRGVGKALVDACEKWAVAQGCKRILVTSGEERHEAHAFYEAMGYHHYARRFAKKLGS